MLSDDDRRPILSPTDNDEPTDLQTIQKPKQRKRKISFTNLPFIYFIVGALLSIGCSILYLVDNDIAFIIAGVLGMVICTFGIRHFRSLINLKIEIDKFTGLNRKFHQERTELKRSLAAISAANNTLSDTHNRLKVSNKKNRDNLVIFRGIQYNMEQFNAQSMAEVTDILGKASNIERRWHEELFKQERRLLYTVFDRFCSQQNHIGMNEEEFRKFTCVLPKSYQDRFARMGTFKKLAGNKSEILLDDFANTLDIFAEMQTSNIDIEFEIQKTKTKRELSPRRSLAQRKTQFLSKQQRTSILHSIAEYAMMEMDEDKSNVDVDEDNVNMDDIEERKYDEELLMYQSQIVITKRSNPEHILFGSPYASLVGIDELSPQESTLDQWLETDTMTPMTPTLHSGPKLDPYYRANTFRNNKMIKDISISNTNVFEVTNTRSRS